MIRYLALLAAALSAVAQSNLPQSVYDDWAGTNAVVTMPQGTYALPGSAPLVLHRSGVTVNFGGCTLLVNPADKANDGFYPIQVASLPGTNLWVTGGNTRHISHLSGSIAECTTQLTMDPAEVVPLTPGEGVLIWAGATPSDPVEPAAFIPATVAGVTNGVITFAAPLGKLIPNYGSLAGLSNVTDASLQWKIGAWGTWPSGANFSKGYGVDHGLERFVGGMVHDVVFNDVSLSVSLVDAAHSPNAMWDVSAVAVDSFTLRNFSVTNPHGNVVHFWRTFNALVDGAHYCGAGRNKINNSAISEAFALTAWGGSGLTYTNINVGGTDIAAFNTEVGSDNIAVNGLNFDVTFTSARTYPSSPTVLNFHATTRPRITDASIHAVTTGGSAHTYYSYLPLLFDGLLSFPGSSLTTWFDFGYQKFPVLAGTVQLGGVVYGPSVALATNVTLLHGEGSRLFTPPEGIYTTGRLRLTTLGSVRDVSDSQGGSYWPAISTGAWVAVLPERWHQIGAGDANLAGYMSKGIRFWFNSPSTADAVLEFEGTLLPRQ
jgi:hypothetical protein